VTIKARIAAAEPIGYDQYGTQRDSKEAKLEYLEKP
jgi:hypothetical protein